jgi:prevent-host-death family protein
VSVSEFKRNPSKYLRRTAAGLSFLILDRGKPVATIRPVEIEDDVKGHAEKLVNLGVARRPKRSR